MLHRRFLAEPVNLQQLTERVDQLATGFFTRARIKALTDSYKELVRAGINHLPDLSAPAHHAGGLEARMQAWDAEVERLQNIPAEEQARFHAMMDRPMPFFLGTPLVGDGSVMFGWDPAEDLKGDTIQYDLQVSTSPTFATMAYEKTDFSELLVTVEDLPPGTYYWRVIARDDVNPGSNWQLAFDEVHIDNTRHMGVGTFVVP